MDPPSLPSNNIPHKSINIELESDNKNRIHYLLELNLNNDAVIFKAIEEDENLDYKKYISKMNYSELIHKHKIFSCFANITEVFLNISEIIKKEKISITENEKNLEIKLPINFGLIKEINFELEKDNLSNEENIEILKQNLKKQNNNIQVLTKEINLLKKENKILKEKIEEYTSDSFLTSGIYNIFPAHAPGQALDYEKINNTNMLILNKFDPNKETQKLIVKKQNYIQYIRLNNKNQGIKA